MFAVVRHPETGGLGVVPAAAVEFLRNNGWVRVSEHRGEPGAFHLPEFADSPDLDAPQPPESPAVPDKEED